ncbi:MAG TPA: DUF2061 domain-containing protein [Massilibacterium sp.]|nr:DUF2061 domain-containing protein [Massilibacterium sp.]
METIKRSLLKTFSWRFIAVIITSSLVYILTGELELSATLGIVDTLVKIFIYYLHERTWNKISYGKKDVI